MENKFFTLDKGKKTPYIFKSKKDEEEYREISLEIWGAIPHQPIWATETNIYKQAKAKRQENDPNK